VPPERQQVDSPILVSVNIGKAKSIDDVGKSGRTAIDKRSVAGRVAVSSLGVAGDEQADRENHGGTEQAVYAYAAEDLADWARKLGRDLHPGQFGENLSTLGVDVTGALIGETWRIGTVLLQVSAPRIPCVVFQNWLGEPQWVKRFTAEAKPGAYLRVLEAGELGAGDPIVVEHRPDHDVTIGLTFRAMTTDRSLLPQLLAAHDLSPANYEYARNAATTP
jgi:MOSC domain-containing protein YiiM